MSNEVQVIENKQDNPTPMGIISQMVTSGSMDVETVKGLLDIQKNYELQESIKSFNRDFAMMRSEMPIFKREKKAYTTTYTPLEDIMKLAQPVMSKYGFSASFSTNQIDTKSVSVSCDIMHRDGHSKSTSLIVPVEVVTKGMNSMQALGSAITYGKRYTLSGLLNIVTADDQDNNGFAESARTGKPKLSDDQMEKAKQSIADGKITIDKVISLYDLTPHQAIELAKVEANVKSES